jgi:electron transfer flavoprotein alpha/beta subunit
MAETLALLAGAALLGGIQGLEREWLQKPAGLRTHMLVALGAAVFVLAPRQAGVPDNDIARVVQGVAAGVGFIGAGTILKNTATREIEGGQAIVEVPLPAIFSVQKGLNEPRYASLPGIMKAKKKPLEVLKPADLGVDVAPRLVTLKVQEPPKRQAGIKVDTVAVLVDKLRNEAHAI